MLVQGHPCTSPASVRFLKHLLRHIPGKLLVLERPNALLQPALDLLPLVGTDQAGNQVERQDFLDAVGILVYGEGDTARLERKIGRLLSARDLLRSKSCELLR